MLNMLLSTGSRATVHPVNAVLSVNLRPGVGIAHRTGNGSHRLAHGIANLQIKTSTTRELERIGNELGKLIADDEIEVMVKNEASEIPSSILVERQENNLQLKGKQNQPLEKTSRRT